MGEGSWSPIDGSCWYPIDLLQGVGDLPIRRIRGGVSEEATIVVGPYPYPTQKLTVKPEMTDPPPEQLDRIRREQRQVGALWHSDRSAVFDLPLHPPLVPLPSARSFGSSRIFNGKPRSPHTGADFSAAEGTPVLAAAAGTVTLAGSHYYAGNSVFIDHGHELVTMYFHLQDIELREGQTVSRGQLVGTVGATGRTTGAHLHFGVRWHGARVDPSFLLGVEPLVELNSDAPARRLAQHPKDSL
jgi:murein DD-endopeptidase MepM/ murein hydrolase activator NlpD